MLLALAGCRSEQPKAVGNNKPAAKRGLTLPELNLDRPHYRHSIVPGGVDTAEEMKQKMKADPVVARHYEGLNPDRMRPVRQAADQSYYVSYRVGNQVFWTSRKVALKKGETVLTDGEEWVRGRCGNRMSLMARYPSLPAVEPPPAVFDEPLTLEMAQEPAGVALSQALPLDGNYLSIPFPVNAVLQEPETVLGPAPAVLVANQTSTGTGGTGGAPGAPGAPAETPSGYISWPTPILGIVNWGTVTTVLPPTPVQSTIINNNQVTQFFSAEGSTNTTTQNLYAVDYSTHTTSFISYLCGGCCTSSSSSGGASSSSSSSSSSGGSSSSSSSSSGGGSSSSGSSSGGSSSSGSSSSSSSSSGGSSSSSSGGLVFSSSSSSSSGGAEVPEPGTLGLVAVAVALAIAVRRRSPVAPV